MGDDVVPGLTPCLFAERFSAALDVFVEGSYFWWWIIVTRGGAKCEIGDSAAFQPCVRISWKISSYTIFSVLRSHGLQQRRTFVSFFVVAYDGAEYVFRFMFPSPTHPATGGRSQFFVTTVKAQSETTEGKSW